MQITAIRTPKIEYGQSLEEILDESLKDIVENDIIIITSKILSILEGSFVSKDISTKYELIKQEADYLLESDSNLYDTYITIKNDILIASAGIDESNVDGVYLLYPKNIQESAFFIWEYLKKKHNIQKVGVVITDSHTTIMRKGVTGIALGWCGFKPLYSYVNKPDIYGNLLKTTQVNILDSLATSAVFIMGEGNEQTPIAIIKDAPKISFLDRRPTEEEIESIKISPEQDLYAPLLTSSRWKKRVK